MSAAPPGGGQPPPEVTAEMLLAAQLDMIARIIPGIPPAALQKAYQAAAMQEEGLGQVWLDIAEGEKPFLALRLSRGNNDGPPITLAARKRLTGNITAEEFRDFATVFGVLTSPMLRTMLMLAGWRIEFAPSNGPSKIILNG